MQSQQFFVHYVLVKKCSLKPFLNFDNESVHIRESGNEFHLSIYGLHLISSLIDQEIVLSFCVSYVDLSSFFFALLRDRSFIRSWGVAGGLEGGGGSVQ